MTTVLRIWLLSSVASKNILNFHMSLEKQGKALIKAVVLQQRIPHRIQQIALERVVKHSQLYHSPDHFLFFRDCIQLQTYVNRFCKDSTRNATLITFVVGEGRLFSHGDFPPCQKQVNEVKQFLKITRFLYTLLSLSHNSDCVKTFSTYCAYAYRHGK